MTTAYLSMGSNLGDRAGYLARAVGLLQAPHTQVVQVSGLYETAPQGKTDQPDFYNIAVKVETTLGPLALLAHTQGVERQLGRERKERWGPRTIDIDILLYGDQAVDLPELTVPHPRMWERAFVLIPLLAIAPGRSDCQQALQALPDQGVRTVTFATPFLQRGQAVE